MTEARAAGLVLPASAYHTGVKVCAKAGKWRPALKMLQECEAAGLKLTAEVYSHAIKACCTQKQTTDARALFQRCAAAGLASPYALTTLLKAYEKSGEWQLAYDVITQTSGVGGASGVPLDRHMYASAIAACTTAGRGDDAAKLREHGRTSGVLQRS